MLYYQVMIGVKSTNCLIAMIYQKQLRLSAATNKRFAQGEITNFVQVDSYQLLWVCFDLADVLQVPIVFAYCFTMLFYTLGLSFFSGVAVFVVAFMTNVAIGLILEKQ